MQIDLTAESNMKNKLFKKKNLVVKLSFGCDCFKAEPAVCRVSTTVTWNTWCYPPVWLPGFVCASNSFPNVYLVTKTEPARLLLYYMTFWLKTQLLWISQSFLHLKVLRSESIRDRYCTGITNLVLRLGVLNRCLVFSDFIHLPEDTLNGKERERKNI